MLAPPRFDDALIGRYDTTGPRYTSYPTAPHFSTAFSERELRAAAARSRRHDRPLSLYFHLPFCARVCFYCACTKVITANRQRAQPYLEHLHAEVAAQAALHGRGRTVAQLHWGGGTPTFLSLAQMRELMAVTERHFGPLDPDAGEFSIEIDPREADADTIAALRELGFNRLSLGVQDFDPRVQRAVNRLQSEALTLEIMAAARDAGFRSLNLDLIYGLPRQSAASFGKTLEKVIAAGPDRLSVFNYAHLPEMFKTQRQIDASTLPSSQEKLAILRRTIEQLTAAGYVYIGMDHFARPDDELALALADGSLGRNFQGYTTHGDCDLVGLGMSAISAVSDTYSQNLRELGDYMQSMEKKGTALARGKVLSTDDLVRRDVIRQILCRNALDIAATEAHWDIDFRRYFAAEIEALGALADDGLIAFEDERIDVLPAGRLLARNVAMVFDAYLDGSAAAGRFSRVI